MNALDELLQTTRNIYAVGRNYVAHIRELGSPLPDEPVIFSKNLSSLTTATELVFPAHLQPVHYEAELVLRIGRSFARGARVDSGAISHLGVGLDFTARALQNSLKEKGLPWHLSKNFEHACFVAGLRRDVNPETVIHFELAQNGNLRQRGNTRYMMFSYERVLTYLNRFAALEEGDLVFTGTPAGVGPVASGDQLDLSCGELDLRARVSIAFD